jgi:hypothetical protein
MLLEIILRYEYFDDFINPNSFLGNGQYRQKAIKEFGLEKIHWITIGDSRTDWGIEHNQLRFIQKQNGVNHLRMSFESSNFMAIQATIDWSIANMPNLKGIMIGVVEENFGHFSNESNQYKVAWPYREYFNSKLYNYFKEEQSILSYLERSAIYVYKKDLKQFLSKVYKRLKKINVYINTMHDNIFDYNRAMPGNLCKYPVDTLKQCVQLAKTLSNGGIISNNTEQFILKLCDNQNAKHLLDHELQNYKINESLSKKLVKNWQILFSNILNKKIKLRVVVLPEHTLLNYIIKPSNTVEIFDQIMTHMSHNEGFELLDLRMLFKSRPIKSQCKYFYDPIHYNDIGKKIITEKIINSFK